MTPQQSAQETAQQRTRETAQQSLAVSFDDVFVLYESTDDTLSNNRVDALATFGSAVAALRGLSLDVGRGECVVVRGPSGSGKSTLVGVVTGQVMPSAGMLRYFQGDELVSGEVLRSTGKLSVVTQGSGRELLPELTCIQNVALAAELRGKPSDECHREAEAVMSRFRILNFAHRKPTDLSGGEAQKVALAAALASNPTIVVADEPTGDLDRQSADEVYDLLIEHAQRTGAALLVVSHDERAERIANRVVSIRDGRFEGVRYPGEGTLAAVVDDRGWMRLPEAERRATGIVDRVFVSHDEGGIRLQPGAGDRLPEGRRAVSDPNANPAPGTSDPAHAERTVLVRVRDASVVLAGSQGAAPILAPTSLEVHRGGLLVVAGPSGSGKTTMLSVLGGLRTASTGTIEFPSPLARDFTIGFGPQVPGFANDATVRANVELPSRLRGVPPDPDRLFDMLCALGIDHLAARPLRTLSGGERQRAGVARVLLTSADLLLIDEPTSQLDEVSAARTVAAIRLVAQRGTAIVVASHDESVISVADDVVTLA